MQNSLEELSLFLLTIQSCHVAAAAPPLLFCKFHVVDHLKSFTVFVSTAHRLHVEVKELRVTPNMSQASNHPDLFVSHLIKGYKLLEMHLK